MPADSPGGVVVPAEQESVAIMESRRGDIVVSEEPLHERPRALAG
jgi:hypothetical protein